MAAFALPYGSELYVFQQNEEGKIMAVKLSKEYFEEGERSVMDFLKVVVVDVIQSNGIMLLEWTVKSCTWHRCITCIHARHPWRNSWSSR